MCWRADDSDFRLVVPDSRAVRSLSLANAQLAGALAPFASLLLSSWMPLLGLPSASADCNKRAMATAAGSWAPVPLTKSTGETMAAPATGGNEMPPKANVTFAPGV